MRLGDDMTDGVVAQQNPNAVAKLTRPGRPARGGALWWARRVVLGVRLALVVLAAVSGVIAARTEDTDRTTSNMWTVVLLAAVVAIPLGGLVWWVESSTPPAWRSREWIRTAGRWVRAVLAAGGLALASYGAIAEMTGLTIFALLLTMFSPFAYLAITAIGNAVSPPVWAPPAELEQPDENLRAVLASAWETLVEPGRQRTQWTIRPRPPATGTPIPPGFDAWFRNAALGTDGQSLMVTGRAGKNYRIPLAGPGSYGAAGLLVVRETVVTRTQVGWSPPRSRELLCVIDSTGRRMLDIELYGWTRSDLVTLARAAGLRLDRYAPQDRQPAVPTVRGQAPTPFDLAMPKVSTHRTVRGRSPWRDALLVTTIIVLTVAVYFGIIEALNTILPDLALPEPWPTIVTILAGAVMFGGVVFAARWLATWYERKRQATRGHTYDPP